MEVRNCKGCGKLFNYVTGPSICPRCTKELDDKFTEVKIYIYDHPGAGIQEVSETMEVSIGQIKRWIREERLEFSEQSMFGIECEKCGAMIRTGRFCHSCKEKLANNLSNIYREPEVEKKTDRRESAKMRFLSEQQDK